MAITDIVFEFEFEQSIIIMEETLLLGIIHNETEASGKGEQREKCVEYKKFSVKEEGLPVQTLWLSIKCQVYDWPSRGADTWKKSGPTGL